MLRGGGEVVEYYVKALYKILISDEKKNIQRTGGVRQLLKCCFLYIWSAWQNLVAADPTFAHITPSLMFLPAPS